MTELRPLPAAIDAAKAHMVEGRDIPWLMRTNTERFGDKPFLIWEPFSGESRTWTYSEFRHEARSLAGSMANRGVAPGDRVLVHMENCPEFMLSWFACAELGAIAVSTNTNSVARDIEYFSKHVEAKAAITQPQYASLISENTSDLAFLAITSTDAGEPVEAPTVDHVPFDSLIAEGEPIAERPTDPMASLGIQFTSGTTSRPKAVLWTHANAIFAAQATTATLKLRHEDVCLTFLPLFHTNAQSYSMLTSLWVGGTIVLQPRFSASRFWDASHKHSVTWCSIIPFCVKSLLTRDDLPKPGEHTYRFWAPAVTLPMVTQALGIPTMAFWGMTETVTHGIVGCFDHPKGLMWIGRPSPAYEINIRRPDGTPISPGERGHLFIRGVRGITLFKEYYGNPEATADSFDEDGWFDTGDVIRMDDDGELFFSDRDKDMMKVGGENVAASEIEMLVLESGLVAECAAVGQPHSMLDEVPVLFIIPNPAAGDDVSAKVLEHCEKNLAKFKVPHEVVIVEDFPRSALEKIAKAQLRDALPMIEA